MTRAAPRNSLVPDPGCTITSYAADGTQLSVERLRFLAVVTMGLDLSREAGGGSQTFVALAELPPCAAWSIGLGWSPRPERRAA